MWDLVIVAVGLAGLWIGTELVVPAAVDLAKRRGVSETLIGLTVLSIGTDLPELIVALDGGLVQLRGVEASGVILGNAVGSCMAQGSLVLGVAIWARSGPFRARLARRDALALAVSIAVLGVLALDGQVTRVEGGVLVGVYVSYLALLARSPEAHEGPAASWAASDLRITLNIVGGLVLILVSAELVVQHSIAIAEAWGIAQGVVGALLIGAGTSLPELALSFSAASRGRTSLSLANVMGSNVFDLLVPTGASAALHPLRVEGETLWLDLPAVAIATGLVFVMIGSGRALRRRDAALLVGLYGLYATARVLTGR